MPTDAERDAVVAVLARREKHPPLPLLTSSKNGDCAHLTYEHPDQVVAKCVLATQIAADDDKLAQLIVSQLVNTTARGNEVHTRDLNLALTVVQGIEPKDTVEALLATQMAAVHIETMKATCRLANAEMIPQHDSALMAVNKLARTFAAQVEALKKHRSAGEQSIRVEHVTVNEGGQAIVGVVSPQGGGGMQKSRANLMNLVQLMNNAPAARPRRSERASLARPRRCAPGRHAGSTAQKPEPQQDRQTALGVTVCTLRKASKRGGV